MPGRSSRARQSRLTFTPLPSSSPATKGYHKQIQARAAAVGYDGPPGSSKRRKLQPAEETLSDDDLASAQLDGVNDELPTPAATMDRDRDASSDEDSEPIKPTQRRSSTNDRLTSRKRSRQQQLDFSGARDSDSFSPPVKLPSSSGPQSSARAGMFGTQPRKQNRKQQPVVDISSDESVASDTLPSPVRIDTKSGVKMGRKAGKDGSSRKEQGRVTRSSQRPIVVESDEDDNIVVGRQPQRADESEEDDEDEMPTTAGRRPRARRRQRSKDSSISSSPPRAIDSDDDLEIIEKPKRRHTRRAESDDSEEDPDEDEDDVPVTPSRRRFKQPRRLTQQEQEDLAEDVEDLAAASDVEALNSSPQTTQRKEKNARQAALEKLKRKRSGQSDPIETIQEDEEEDEAGDDFDELYEDDDAVPQPTSSRQMSKADEDDEDFIEEEEVGDDPLGIPDGIPIEFTRHAKDKAKDLFKHAIEWMVQKKINPAFQMTDEIYGLAFRKLDDEVKTLAGSKFASAIWTPAFTMAFKSRPDIAFEPLDRTGGDMLPEKCDACNRSKRPATYQIQFQGKPYHPHTLEEVAGQDEDSDDDSDASSSDDNAEQTDTDDLPGRDYNGREIPPANTIYYVGKFCMANAETAHALSHWRYHLNEWVVQWLTQNGYNTNEKIVQRDQWNTKKRRKYANKIADRMEKEGVVGELWREFRRNLDEARSSKQGRFTAGDD